MSLEAQRIYVRLPNWVGDVVLATPFLRTLRRELPQAEIVAHGKARTLEVLAGEGLWDRALPLQRTPGWLWPIREGRRVRQECGELDLALILPNSFSSALLARFSGARQRVGYRLNGRGCLLTRALPVKKQGRLRPIPMVDYYLGMLDALGVSVAGVPRCPTLTMSETERARGAALLREQGVAPGERVWALNLGGAWLTKRWVPAHAGQLVRLLREAGITPFLLWGPGEEQLREETVQAAGGDQLPGSKKMVGLTDLAPLLSHCELFVTTDSGPRHFGIAAEIPVLVLIGSTHPGYTMVDYQAIDLLCEEVDCWPCHLKECPVDFRCMQRLTGEKVLSAGRALLARLEREGWRGRT